MEVFWILNINEKYNHVITFEHFPEELKSKYSIEQNGSYSTLTINSVSTENSVECIGFFYDVDSNQNTYKHFISFGKILFCNRNFFKNFSNF